MKAPIIVFRRLPASGMAIFPFIFIKNERFKKDFVLLNHEKIHLRQQLEMLIVPFYLAYLLHYLFILMRFKNHHEAYLAIAFEKEAYDKEADLNYLLKRKFWAWLTCI